jgi:hypothetical protein
MQGALWDEEGALSFSHMHAQASETQTQLHANACKQHATKHACQKHINKRHHEDMSERILDRLVDANHLDLGPRFGDRKDGLALVKDLMRGSLLPAGGGARGLWMGVGWSKGVVFALLSCCMRTQAQSHTNACACTTPQPL